MARAYFVVAAILLACTEPLFPFAAHAELDVGYYDDSCPAAEDIVRSIVEEAVSWNSGLAPGLVRLHFHDCFVQGCDASILLDSVPNSGKLAEKDHPANLMSLRGMDVIDCIKNQLEQECPRTVSCADILAFAARDAVNILGGPAWPVPGGRLDGRVSSAEEAGANLPSPTFDLHQLTQSFASKGFSQEDMIILSGAHTIGDSHCNAFKARLYNFSATQSQDPRLDASLVMSLKRKCAANINREEPIVVGMDTKSPRRVDVGYYQGLQEGRGLFQSDVTLLSSPSTSKFVIELAKDENFWFDSFADAMFRMSHIDVKTYNRNNYSPNGEIRVNCHVINYSSY